MGDYMVLGADGALRFDFSALPEGATKAMAEVTQEEFNARHAGETRPVRRTRFKLHSKLTALERLGQHLGLFKPALDADGTTPRRRGRRRPGAERPGARPPHRRAPGTGQGGGARGGRR